MASVLHVSRGGWAGHSSSRPLMDEEAETWYTGHTTWNVSDADMGGGAQPGGPWAFRNTPGSPDSSTIPT